jgi:hypothetical protein
MAPAIAQLSKQARLCNKRLPHYGRGSFSHCPEELHSYNACVSQTTERLAMTFAREVAPHSAELISFKVSSK